MLLGFTYFATVAVLAILVWIVHFRPWLIVRPSVLFLGLFWLQVQFASAWNAAYLYQALDDPWAYAAVAHAFPLAVAILILPSFQGAAARVADRLSTVTSVVQVRDMAWPLLILVALIYAVAGFYLARVPFDRTGLYALLFQPELLDQYREESMKLLGQPLVAYSFTIMEKVLAPLAAGFSGAIFASAVAHRRWSIAAAAVVSLVVIAAPTLLYGARGPLTMVVLAAVMTLLLINARRLRIVWLAAGLALTLLPIALVASLRDDGRLGFHIANIVDRAVGRGYMDNVWHVSHVERNGFFGIAGIEKLAPLVGVEPVDMLNVVGREYSGRVTSSGLAFLGVSEPPIACEIRLECPTCERYKDGFDLSANASSGAAFSTLNYAMFGYWSLPISVLMVLALDLLLFLYLRLPAASLAATVGAVTVPILSLCFSMATTVMASKGLLLIPLLGWLTGMRLRRST